MWGSLLALADTPVTDVLPLFSVHEVPVAFLSPTQTGLDKGIIDCIGSVRDFLREQHLHDYAAQGLGQKEHGQRLPAFFVQPDRLENTNASLYRPRTKRGDPR